MTTAKINDELSLTYPKGFREMGESELHQAYANDYPNMWGLRDEKRHIILVVFWKESSELLGKLVSTKSLAKRAQKQMIKAMRSHDCQTGELFSRELCGLEAWGFEYSYRNADASQQAETIVFKRGACCYTLYYYTRPERAEANKAVHDQILASMTLD